MARISLALAVCFAVVRAQEHFPVTQQCLRCLCEAISSCNTNTPCSGDVCGPFRITRPYWVDAGEPTIDGEAPESNTAYSNCARDAYCSALAVQGYMSKYQKDCNGDHIIDCDDFAIIHQLGRYACNGTPLPGVYGHRYQKCKAIVDASN